MGAVVFAYTRAEALRDGVLVALDHELVGEAGYRLPVALTATAHAVAVALTPSAARRGEDVVGRAWDVLWMARGAVRQAARTGDRHLADYLRRLAATLREWR